jgi:dTDP-glucose 4,6-dehydratase
MRLLVTGGAGFIGSSFVKRQLARGGHWSSVTVLDALTYAGNLDNLADIEDSKNFRFIKGDIRDHDLVMRELQDIDVVVHFAAESHVDRSIQGASEFVSTNVLGTQNLLESARLVGVGQFIHISTDEVYGSIPEGSWSEESILLPNSPYSASKASSDLIARAYHKTYGMDVRITRCSNNYGPNQFPEKMIPLFVTNLIDDLPVPLYGSGSNVRDWLHVTDHCRGIEAILAEGAPGEIYNIGGGTELTNLELTHKVLEIMGKDESYIRHVDDRQGHDLRYSVNIEKIQRTTGYSPVVDFENGLVETVNWYRDNQAWWRPLKMKLHS